MQVVKILTLTFLIKILFVSLSIFSIKLIINSSFLKESSPFIIATFTLIVTFIQLRTNDKHNRLSVRPLLNIAIEPIHRPGTDGHFSISLIMENNGLGPANISNTYWKLEDKIISHIELTKYLERISNLDYLYQQNKINYETEMMRESSFHLKQDRKTTLLRKVFYPISGLHEIEKKEIIKILDAEYQKIMHEIEYNISFMAVSRSIYGDNLKYIDTAKDFKKQRLKNLTSQTD